MNRSTHCQSSRQVKIAVFAGMVAACAAQAQMPQLPGWVGPNGAAKVLVAEGNVSVLKDTQAWALMAGQSIPPRQEIVTGHDGYALLELSDGSRFEVFANSRATFRHNSGNLRDLIDLWVGRVKVHINKLNGEPNPNRVRTPTAVISVRGTIFDVVVDPEEDVTTVAVEEGQVAVQHAILPYTEAKVLNPGDSIRVYKNAPIARNRIDRGMIAQKVARALSDLAVFRGPRLGSGGSAPGAGGGSIPGGGGLPGDTAGPTPPPPPPPPANPGN